MKQIYLDYNATTPLAQEVVAAMEPFLRSVYGNPSSTHWAGVPTRDAVEEARSQVASLLCCDATEVVFTSGGTEANNLAIKGLFFARGQTGKSFHVITTRIEHPAVLEPCRFLEMRGATVTRVPVNGFGLVDPDDIRRAIQSDTALVSVMHANNEVGTIQRISDIASIAHACGALFHTDAAQTVGKITVDVESLGVDLLSIAGHKLYAPKGVGALYIRDGVTLEPLLHGAAHEAGRRAGTENVLEIVGLGAACAAARSWIDDPQVSRLRDALWGALQSLFGDAVSLNGPPDHRLPNTLNVSFLGQHGHELLAKMPYIAASTGSACHAGSLSVSPVLTAMGVSQAAALGAVRFSLGRYTTPDEIESLIESLKLQIPERTSRTATVKPLAEHSHDEIKAAVAAQYGRVATCPTEKFNFPVGRKFAESVGYPSDILDRLPASMWESFTGAGNPQPYVNAKPGELLLDLGSGAGLDLFLYAHKVGPTGRLLGLDLAQPMLDKAKSNLASLGVSNVEWLNAPADAIPLPDNSVDLVTANGIYNLSPDKDAVMREVRRVLKTGGRTIFAEIVLKSELPHEVQREINDWFRCIGGALVQDEFLRRMESHGLANPQVLWLGRNARTGHESAICAVIRAEKLGSNFASYS